MSYFDKKNIFFQFEEVQLVERPSNVWGVEDSTNCLDLHSVSEELDMILSLPDSVEPVIGMLLIKLQSMETR